KIRSSGVAPHFVFIPGRVAAEAGPSSLHQHLRTMKRKITSVSNSRRDIVKKGALAATAVMAGCSPQVAETVQRTASAPAAGSVLRANDQLRVAFIGVGGQGFNSHVRNVVNMRDGGGTMHEHEYN